MRTYYSTTWIYVFINHGQYIIVLRTQCSAHDDTTLQPCTSVKRLLYAFFSDVNVDVVSVLVAVLDSIVHVRSR